MIVSEKQMKEIITALNDVVDAMPDDMDLWSPGMMADLRLSTYECQRVRDALATALTAEEAARSPKEEDR